MALISKLYINNKYRKDQNNKYKKQHLRRLVGESENKINKNLIKIET
jgi:hypothetical protein